MYQNANKVDAIVAATLVFHAQKTSFALIGGVAVGIHSGVPRATQDVDFAVSTHSDFAALIGAFEAAGFVLKGQFAHSINFRHDSGEPVQLAFDDRFDEMLERVKPLKVGEITTSIIDKDDLIAMKKLAAADGAPRKSKSLQDLADVALLEGDKPDADEGW